MLTRVAQGIPNRGHSLQIQGGLFRIPVQYKYKFCVALLKNMKLLHYDSICTLCTSATLKNTVPSKAQISERSDGTLHLQRKQTTAHRAFASSDLESIMHIQFYSVKRTSTITDPTIDVCVQCRPGINLDLTFRVCLFMHTWLGEVTSAELHVAVLLHAADSAAHTGYMRSFS